MTRTNTQLELERERTKQLHHIVNMLIALQKWHPNVQASMVDVIRKLLEKAKII